MVNIYQAVLSLLTLRLPVPYPDAVPQEPHDSKSIAIIGAGSAGLAMLKSFLDLPDETREGWRIALFEQRDDVGGIWLPESRSVHPPVLPETPLYPLLHTNTPVPSMTYPGFPFSPGTPLYPSHEYIQAYHSRYALHFNLTRHIHFHHTVTGASWNGTSERGFWDVTYRNAKNKAQHRRFGHLVVAAGHNHFPREPAWPGQEEWLSNTPPEGPAREILHSLWYREPSRYTNRRVLIVGYSASGRDAASQIAPLALETFVSVRSEPNPVDGPIDDRIQMKPEISNFTRDAVVFKDGTMENVDAVLLATGYEVRFPFLDEGGTLFTDPLARSNTSRGAGLVTNLRYVFPLHKHILSLCPSHPTNALAFIGLPSKIANCPSDVAQSLYATHAFINGSFLPPRDELLKELARQEQALRSHGYDPYILGHKLVNGTASDYQDDLVAYLKEEGAIPNDGKKYVEGWRRDLLTYSYLKRGWKRIEEEGAARQWLEGVQTEEQWATLMKRINAWQKAWERVHNITFVPDKDLVG